MKDIQPETEPDSGPNYRDLAAMDVPMYNPKQKPEQKSTLHTVPKRAQANKIKIMDAVADAQGKPRPSAMPVKKCEWDVDSSPVISNMSPISPASPLSPNASPDSLHLHAAAAKMRQTIGAPNFANVAMQNLVLKKASTFNFNNRVAGRATTCAVRFSKCSLTKICLHNKS